MLTTSTNKQMFSFLAVLTADSMASLQGYTMLFNTFAVETIHLEGLHVESVSEIPGFLALTGRHTGAIFKQSG